MQPRKFNNQMLTQNTPKDLEEIKQKMYFLGFRPFAKEDILSGQKGVMIDVSLYHWSGGHLPRIGSIGAAEIVLAQDCVWDVDGVKMVHYFRTSPKFPQRQNIPMEKMIRNFYTPQDSMEPALRFFVKR